MDCFLDSVSSSGVATPLKKWVLIAGDSITEGVKAYQNTDDVLSDYSFLLGESLSSSGYDYDITASVGSGYYDTGDYDHQVPGYYSVHSGTYHPELSRWYLIDHSTSILDSNQKISAYGVPGTEPDMIIVNYGTNEVVNGDPTSDIRLSVSGLSSALRSAAPLSEVIILVPFTIQSASRYPSGQGYADAITQGATDYNTSNSTDAKFALIDLGGDFANLIQSSVFMAPDPNSSQ